MKIGASFPLLSAVAFACLLAFYAIGHAWIMVQTIEILPPGRLFALPGIHYFCIYESWISGAQGGWAPYMLSDPPEGTRSILMVPSWMISAAGAAITLCLGKEIFNRKSENEN